METTFKPIQANQANQDNQNNQIKKPICLNKQTKYSTNTDNINKTTPDKKCVKKKKKKTRCFNCNKHIGLLKFNCKCSDKNFCSSCVQPELHKCTFNFKADKDRLKKSLVKITNQKIIPI